MPKVNFVNEKTEIQVPDGSNLRRIARGRTLIIIPNRLQWLHHVDRVIVLRESEFHATGTHDELLEASELYRHMQYVRFNAFRHVAID